MLVRLAVRPVLPSAQVGVFSGLCAPDASAKVSGPSLPGREGLDDAGQCPASDEVGGERRAEVVVAGARQQAYRGSLVAALQGLSRGVARSKL